MGAESLNALPEGPSAILSSWNDYALVSAKCALSIFEQAEREQQYPLATEHVWTFVDSISDSLTTVILQITFVAIEALFCGTSICKYQWKQAFYHLSAAVTVDPLIVLGSIVSRIMRIVASLVGTISPAYALSGWRLAEVCDIALLELKKGLFTLISPDPSNSHIYEDEPILPTSAVSYLQRERCMALYEHTIPEATITKLDQDLKTAIASFIQVIRDTDREKLIEITHFHEIKSGAFQGSPELKAILHALFASATTPNNLPEKIQRGALSAKDARLLYKHIKGGLFVPPAANAPPAPESALNQAIEPYRKAIDRLMSERFSFGTVSYHL